MKRIGTCLLALSLGSMACSSSSGGGGSSGADATADTAGPDAAGEDSGPADTGAPEKDPRWTLATDVPAGVAGKTMRQLGGYQQGGATRLYFCGDGGVFRVRVDGEWKDQDLTTSDNVLACHARADDLMAGVGELGHVWKWGGTGNWQSNDLLLVQPGLRAVWIVDDGTLVVAGVAGTVQRLNVTTWTDEKRDDVDATLTGLWGSQDGELLVAVGEGVLLANEGQGWAIEDVPQDPPGTPEANKGFKARAVWGADAEHVWAVGDLGKIALRDGLGVWTYQESQWHVTPFQAVFGTGPTDVYAAATKGQLRHFDGAEWTVLEAKTPLKDPITGEDWPKASRVQSAGAVDYVGGYATDPDHVWLFGSAAQLIQYNDEW